MRKAPCCPIDGSSGDRVDWLTVAALSRGPLPEKEDFWRCQSTDCTVAYWSETGTRIARAAVPVLTESRASELLCYCFNIDERTLHSRPELLAYVESRVREASCACRVRNPSGKCCLPVLCRALADERESAADTCCTIDVEVDNG